MYKVGVIGDKDSILGFKALGFAVSYSTDRADTEKALREMAGDGFAVIYITEQAAKDVLDIIDGFSDSQYPAIIPIPGNQGSLGIGREKVKKSVERAVGADILFNETN